jgi:hypothetical protein
MSRNVLGFRCKQRWDLEIVGAGNLEDMIETDVAREQWPEMAVSRAIMGYGPRKGPPNKAFILAFHKRTSTLRAICRQDRVANRSLTERGNVDVRCGVVILKQAVTTVPKPNPHV